MKIQWLGEHKLMTKVDELKQERNIENFDFLLFSRLNKIKRSSTKRQKQF